MSKFHISSFENGWHSFISDLPVCITDYKPDFFFSCSVDMEKKKKSFYWICTNFDKLFVQIPKLAMFTWLSSQGEVIYQKLFFYFLFLIQSLCHIGCL